MSFHCLIGLTTNTINLAVKRSQIRFPATTLGIVLVSDTSSIQLLKVNLSNFNLPLLAILIAFGPNTRLRIFSSNTLSLRSSRNVRTIFQSHISLIDRDVCCLLVCPDLWTCNKSSSAYTPEVFSKNIYRYSIFLEDGEN